MIPRNLRPLFNQVIVHRDPGQEKTDGGLYIPDTAKRPSMFATVVAAGPGKPMPTGWTRPMQVKKNDRVLVGPYGGQQLINALGDDLFFFNDDDILGVIVEE
jgi:chaperonin GroES